MFSGEEEEEEDQPSALDALPGLCERRSMGQSQRLSLSVSGE